MSSTCPGRLPPLSTRRGDRGAEAGRERRSTTRSSAIYFLVVLGSAWSRASRSRRTSTSSSRAARCPPGSRASPSSPPTWARSRSSGMAANGAQYGVATVHFYWIGAVPAMVFLGLVMMPFYYGAKVRTVPEYLRLRFNDAAHALQRGDVRGRHRADLGRQPLRARAGHPPDARAGRSASRSSSPPRSCSSTSRSAA